VRDGVIHKWFDRPNRARQPIWRCTAMAVAITTATLLAGCTQVASAPSSSSLASASPAADAAMDQHLSTAPTCAAATVLESTLFNAHVDLAKGAITEAQWVAVVNSTVIGFRSLAQHPDWGLQNQARSLIGYIDASSPSPSGVLFNPDSPDWDSRRQAFNTSCDTNGTPVALWAATGG
jgi:hypothetical protein